MHGSIKKKLHRHIMHFIERLHARREAPLMHVLCKCQSAQSFCFNQHGFKNHVSLVWTHVINNSELIFTKLECSALQQ